MASRATPWPLSTFPPPESGEGGTWSSCGWYSYTCTVRGGSGQRWGGAAQFEAKRDVEEDDGEEDLERKCTQQTEQLDDQGQCAGMICSWSFCGGISSGWRARTHKIALSGTDGLGLGAGNEGGKGGQHFEL